MSTRRTAPARATTSAGSGGMGGMAVNAYTCARRRNNQREAGRSAQRACRRLGKVQAAVITQWISTGTCALMASGIHPAWKPGRLK